MSERYRTFILSVNCGSSSLKFGLHHSGSVKMELSGVVNQIGTENCKLEIKDRSGNIVISHPVINNNIDNAAGDIITWLKDNWKSYPLAAIGHRLVQGGPDHRVPEIITDNLVQMLQKFVYLAPNHLPDEIKTIKAFQTAFPGVPQVACFDTCFHRHMPYYSKFYPLPAEYKEKGLMRYGFHGLSYEFTFQKLSKHHSAINKKKIIIAHLGNGASMVAVKNGKGIETTMGLSPIGGLVMGTRSGDLDPGVPLFLLKQSGLTIDELDELLSKHSGMKAIAGTGDVALLLKNEDQDMASHEALTIFCYQAKKYIGALTAAMGGLDMLVFTGGIGENSSVIRERICRDLAFLGIKLSKKSNVHHHKKISSRSAKTEVLVIKTNEEWIIANHTQKIIGLKKEKS